MSTAYLCRSDSAGDVQDGREARQSETRRGETRQNTPSPDGLGPDAYLMTKEPEKAKKQVKQDMAESRVEAPKLELNLTA